MVATEASRTILNECWETPDGPVIFQPDTLDIWHCDLEPDEERLNACRQLLSVDEIERAERLKFDEKKQEFIVTRACLRQVLSSALSCAPQELEFVRNQQGKPQLSERFADNRLEFNLAHSHGRAVLAVTSGAPTGVDIEMLRYGTDYMGLAKRFFSDDEQQALLELSGEQQRRAFFACWTRKEAFVKAVGTGIGYGLDKFTVPVSPEIKTAEIKCTKFGQHWRFYDLPVGEDFYAAVVTDGAETELRYWQFS